MSHAANTMKCTYNRRLFIRKQDNSQDHLSNGTSSIKPPRVSHEKGNRNRHISPRQTVVSVAVSLPAAGTSRRERKPYPRRGPALALSTCVSMTSAYCRMPGNPLRPRESAKTSSYERDVSSGLDRHGPSFARNTRVGNMSLTPRLTRRRVRPAMLLSSQSPRKLSV